MPGLVLGAQAKDAYKLILKVLTGKHLQRLKDGWLERGGRGARSCRHDPSRDNMQMFLPAQISCLGDLLPDMPLGGLGTPPRFSLHLLTS